MAYSYTRQSSMSDGDTITAALFNNEYNQLVNAFAYHSSTVGSTGHRHDGTAGHGGNIHTIGDLDFLNKIAVSGNTWGFFVEVSSAAVEQVRLSDGVLAPVTDSDIDLGTSSLEFKDLFIDGTAHIDTLDVDVNGTVAGTFGVTGATTLSSTLAVTGAVTGSSTLQGTTITATTAFVPDASDGAALGTSALEFSDLFLADGAVINFGDDQDITLTHSADTGLTTNGTFQATTITATTAFVPDASDGAALGTSALEFSDLFLADGAVINFGDDQDVSLTHVADTGILLSSTDQLQFGDSGTYIYQSADGVLDLVSDTEIEINATTIDMNGNLDLSGSLTMGSAAISEADIEQIDDLTAGTVTASKAVVVDSNKDIGTFRNVTIDGTFSDGNYTFDTSGNVSGLGTIGSGAITSSGTVQGTTITATTAFVPDASDGAALGTSALEFSDLFLADGAVINFGDDQDVSLTHVADTGLLISSTDQLQFGDSGTYIYQSADGVLDLVSDTEIELTATTIDINGNVDVSGTLTVAGALDFGDAVLSNVGAVQLDSIAGDGDTNTSITFSGSDVITIATGGSGRLTIGDGALSPVTDNEIDLGTSSLEFKNAYFDGTVTSDAFAGPLTGDVTGNVSGTAATVTTAAQTNITSLGTLTALTVDNLGINGNTITANSGALNLTPAGGSAIVLDGTINVDAGVVTGATSITSTAFVGDITGDVTGNASGTAATVTTAAQTNITSLGTLTTLTVDNVITNGTTIGHTSDTDLLTLGSAILTVAGEVSMTTLDIGGTNVASTAAELNLMDGGTSATSTTIVDADRIILNDNGTMVQCAVTDMKTYIGGGTSWQAVKTANFTAAAGQGVFANTTSSAWTVTLPAGTIGDEVSIIDYAGTFDSNNLTVAADGSEKIHGSTDDLTVATERAAFTLVFTDSTQGWLLKDK